jgi:hypothetical protein
MNEISNLNLTSNNTGTTKGIYSKRYDNSAYDLKCSFNNLFINNFGGDGVYTYESREARFYRVFSTNNGGIGINAQSTDSFFDSCSCFTNTGGGMALGVSNQVTNCKTYCNWTFGMQLDSYNTVSSSYIQQEYNHGLVIIGNAVSFEGVIEGCNFTNLYTNIAYIYFKNTPVKNMIKAIIRQHPTWGTAKYAIDSQNILRNNSIDVVIDKTSPNGAVGAADLINFGTNLIYNLNGMRINGSSVLGDVPWVNLLVSANYTSYTLTTDRGGTTTFNDEYMTITSGVSSSGFGTRPSFNLINQLNTAITNNKNYLMIKGKCNLEKSTS